MTRRNRRMILLGATAFTASALSLAISWPSLAGQAPGAARPAPGGGQDPAAGTARVARTVSVATSAQLSAAVAAAGPGDRISVADGTYSAPIRITRSGTAAAPISIVARNLGRALITTADSLRLEGASHITIEGFTFAQNGGLEIPAAATAVRITRNTFEGNKSGAWLVVKGDDTEVDHNLFRNKKNAGVYLQVLGPPKAMAKRVHIHHNYFFNHQFHGGNGGESIRLGLSGLQHGKAEAVVEFNLFEKADGDLEAISVKSTNNIIRYNTIINSRGTITLRHGNGSVVEGNMLIGGNTGIRIFGNDQVVINNVVQNSSGQPIEVGGGEIKDDTNSTTAHEAADRALVAFNTVVARSGNLIKFGGGKKFGPSDTTLANNILTGTGTLINKGQAINPRWQGNIVNGGPAGDIPAGGARSVDPQLVQGPGGLFRLKAGSPAIDAGVGSFPQVSMDIDGQARADAKDVGADEFSATGQRSPLTAADVGPSAP